MASFVQVACASSSIESSPNGSSIGFKPATRKNEKLRYHEGIITLLMARGNKFKDSGAWLACCFILLHFGKWLLKKYHAKFNLILQALLGIRMWNLMTLDLWTFLGMLKC
jgi:hypothetical protein